MSLLEGFFHVFHVFHAFQNKMKNARYILEPYSGVSSRTDCPGCHKRQTFVRYIDLEKNEYLPLEFGKCNREVNCGYWLDPYKEKIWEASNMDWSIRVPEIPKPVCSVQKNPNPDSISIETVLASIKSFDKNNFINFLRLRFGEKYAMEAVKNYLIGTSKHWKNIGATIFWQLDFFGTVRGGKVMAYNSSTGKRIKEPFNHITWVHKILNLEGYNLAQCYFGEHLLNVHKKKPVALVESEKTAIISSFYFPQFVWIASGSLNNISLEKSDCLLGRDLVFFPDLSRNSKAFELWEKKASELSEVANSIEVSRILENLASDQEKESGFDLADYLLTFDLNEFLNNGNTDSGSRFETFEKYVSNLSFEGKTLINGFGYPADWDTISSCKEIDSKTKDFIKLTIKNPALLDLQKSFGLDLK
jgi:hypothetical protein